MQEINSTTALVASSTSIFSDPAVIQLFIYSLIVSIVIQVVIGAFQLWKIIAEMRMNRELRQMDFIIFKRLKR